MMSSTPRYPRLVRRLVKRLFLLCITLSVLTAACSKESSPTAPTPPTPPAATRIIRLGGSLNFGEVSLNTVREDGVLTVSNDGNDILQIAGMSGPCAGNGISPMSTTTFALDPGQTLSVGFSFAPRVPINCSGTLRVDGNHTSGTNTIDIIARGVQPRCQAVPGGLLCE